MDVWCKFCFAYQKWVRQTHCMNPNCGMRFSAWHIAKQLEQLDEQKEGYTVPLENRHPRPTLG